MLHVKVSKLSINLSSWIICGAESSLLSSTLHSTCISTGLYMRSKNSALSQIYVCHTGYWVTTIYIGRFYPCQTEIWGHTYWMSGVINSFIQSFNEHLLFMYTKCHSARFRDTKMNRIVSIKSRQILMQMKSQSLEISQMVILIECKGKPYDHFNDVCILDKIHYHSRLKKCSANWE